jgi:hypothetical protein
LTVSSAALGATAHGFFDSLNAPLDGGNNAGHDNYTTTFTTANSSKEALSIPDFARGPDGADTISDKAELSQGYRRLRRRTRLFPIGFDKEMCAFVLPAGRDACNPQCIQDGVSATTVVRASICVSLCPPIGENIIPISRSMGQIT